MGFNRPASASVNRTINLPPSTAVTSKSYFNPHSSFDGGSILKTAEQRSDNSAIVATTNKLITNHDNRMLISR
jgi:hypothetical protein